MPNLTLLLKVAEDVAVVTGTALVTLSNTHDPATVASAVAAAPAVRGLLASVISKGQERSFTGAVHLIYRVFRALDQDVIPAVEATVAPSTQE